LRKNTGEQQQKILKENIIDQLLLLQC